MGSRTRSRSPRDGAPSGADAAAAGGAAGGSAGRSAARHATSEDGDFGYVVRWTVLGALLPGVGLIAAGRRVAGRIVLALTLLCGAAAVAYVVLHGGPRQAVLDLKTWVLVPRKLTQLAIGVPIVAGVWGLIVVASHLSLQRRGRLRPWQGLLAATVCLAMLVVTAVPAGKGSQYAFIQRDVLTSVFSTRPATVNRAAPAARPAVGPTAPADPWAGASRINVLLMGSDAGDDRIGLRPDSIILASINPKSGDTVLFSLPRNLQGIEFPQGSPMRKAYPHGFRCYEIRHGNKIPACLLNAVWTYGESYRHLFPDNEDSPGLAATEDAVEGITGLRPDYYVMIGMSAFQRFVDAMGGVTVTVHTRLPIGGTGEDPSRSDYHVATGGWIEVGRQKLDGRHAMWFARSRWASADGDYDRMRRQRCVIAAAVAQANPLLLLQRFPQIAKAIKGSLQTDIPLPDLPAWADLALKIRDGGVRSLPFTNQVISTADPDFDKIHKLVQKSLNPPRAAVSPSPAAGSPSPSAHSHKTTPPRPKDSTQAQRVDDVC